MAPLPCTSLPGHPLDGSRAGASRFPEPGSTLSAGPSQTHKCPQGSASCPGTILPGGRVLYEPPSFLLTFSKNHSSPLGSANPAQSHSPRGPQPKDSSSSPQVPLPSQPRPCPEPKGTDPEATRETETALWTCPCLAQPSEDTGHGWPHEAPESRCVVCSPSKHPRTTKAGRAIWSSQRGLDVRLGVSRLQPQLGQGRVPSFLAESSDTVTRQCVHVSARPGSGARESALILSRVTQTQ